MRSRILLFALSLILVPTATILVILFAKGYRPDFKQGQLTTTGLVAATSLPEGAQIIINGELRTATDSTISLAPGDYLVEFKKIGYSTWQKNLKVEAGVVTRAHAFLFPTVPSLKAITASGAANPALSPDGNRVAFLETHTNVTQVFILDLSESPLGSINRDAKLVTTLPQNDYVLTWSPDGKELIGSASPSAYLINLNASTATNVNARLEAIAEVWAGLQQTINAPKLSTLPSDLKSIMATAAADLSWSAREDKIMYTATASAVIPDNLINPLPGSNTQPETRELTAGNIYVYDIEEDKNFLVGTTKGPKLSWFPTSGHIVQVEANKVTVMEYDGANPTVVYAGPMENSFAFPYPSAKQMLILTNLNPVSTALPNLYAVSLR